MKAKLRRQLSTRSHTQEALGVGQGFGKMNGLEITFCGSGVLFLATLTHYMLVPAASTSGLVAGGAFVAWLLAGGMFWVYMFFVALIFLGSGCRVNLSPFS